MNISSISPVLERQLLLQLGDRLKNLRKAQKISTVQLAARVGITRNTLRAIEAGDPSPSMGNYLRVMSALGVIGELALLAGDTIQPPPANSAAARSTRKAPIVKVHVSADDTRHWLQDLQSLALHEEAVRMVKSNPTLVKQALNTTTRWLTTGDTRSASLWHEWERILNEGAWRKVLSPTRHAQQLRQTSPLVTVLSEEVRQQILTQVSRLKKGIVLGDTSKTSQDEV